MLLKRTITTVHYLGMFESGEVRNLKFKRVGNLSPFTAELLAKQHADRRNMKVKEMVAVFKNKRAYTK